MLFAVSVTIGDRISGHCVISWAGLDGALSGVGVAIVRMSDGVDDGMVGSC